MATNPNAMAGHQAQPAAPAGGAAAGAPQVPQQPKKYTDEEKAIIDTTLSLWVRILLPHVFSSETNYRKQFVQLASLMADQVTSASVLQTMVNVTAKDIVGTTKRKVPSIFHLLAFLISINVQSVHALNHSFALRVKNGWARRRRAPFFASSFLPQR